MALSTRGTLLLALGLGLGGLALAGDIVVLDPGTPTKGDKTPGGKPLIDLTGGPPPVTADEGGESPTADHADEADDAPTGTWADEGGESPTADSADHGDTTAEAPTADDATWSDDADHADVAEHAADVADCAGGPWLGGACGDLRTDARLGIGTAPDAVLDVAGTAALGSLQVDADGSVGIGGEVGSLVGEVLRVHGTLQAEALSSRGTAEEWHSASVGFADCRTVQDRTYGSSTSIVDGGLEISHSRVLLHCPVSVPVGATITGWTCDGRDLDVTWMSRPWDADLADWTDWLWELGATQAVDIAVSADAAHLVEVWVYDRFERCTFEYTT